MQLDQLMITRTTLKLDSSMAHTHPMVFWKCTSIIGGGLCAMMGLPQLLVLLHVANLVTPTQLKMILRLTREFFSVLCSVYCMLYCNHQLGYIIQPCDS